MSSLELKRNKRYVLSVDGGIVAILANYTQAITLLELIGKKHKVSMTIHNTITGIK